MISVRKIGRHLGAEIAGVDLSQPLGEGAFARIACAQHKANFDYDLPLRRLMHRTTVRGSVPV